MQEDKKIEEYVITDDSGYGEALGWKEKIGNFLNGKYFIPVIIVLIAVIAFCLGRVSGLQDKKPAVKVISGGTGQTNSVSVTQQKISASTGALQNTAAVSASANTNQSEQVVASKNSTKYHYPWCAGAKQISPQNLITFDSIEAARAAGYTPASNCKGLK
jgi:hypothetical protein